MTEPRTTVATVSVRWASDLQHQAGEKALREVLQAWQEFYADKHKGNEITINVNSPDA